MPVFSALTEDWSSGTIDRTVKWAGTYDPAGNPPAAVVGGRVRVYAASGPKYANVESASIYTLASSQIHVEVPTVAAVTSGSTGRAVTAMVIESTAQPAGTRYMIQYRAELGMLTFENQVGYYEDTPPSVTYSAVTHRWWRARASATQTFFETSPDGSTWTVQRTITSAAWVADAAQHVMLEAWRETGATDFAEFDYINALPTVEQTPTTTAAGSFAAFFGI